MKKLIILTVLFIFVIVIIATGGAYFWYHNAISSPANEKDNPTNIEVKEGEALLDIAPRLEEKSLLNSSTALKVYLRLEEPQLKLLPGSYNISGGLNLPELITALNQGPEVTTVKITIPEGWRYDQIAERLATKFQTLEDNQFSRSEFENIAREPDDFAFTPEVQQFLSNHKPQDKSLEGFLFPDTYILANDATALDVANLMIETLIRRLEENNIDPSNSGRLDNFYEVLKLATIVEREASVYEQMQMISDIFLRRLENGWKLDADATLLYYFKDWSHQLTQAEIEDTSNPYNTRQLTGLTPTPIANPGIKPIKAVLNPKPNEYWYFISKDNQKYYAKTSAGHQRNIEKYLR